MKNIQKTVFAISALTLLSAVMFSCGSDVDKDNSTETTAPTADVQSEQVTDDGLSDGLPERDFAGTEFNILCAAEQWQKYYNSEATGDVIDDAVYVRNTALEERFHVELNYRIYNGYRAGMPEVKTALMGSVMSGSADFDMMVGGTIYTVPLMAENLFVDLNTLEYIHFEQPWWYGYINDTLELLDKQYLAAGSFGMVILANSVVTLFNKELVEQYDLGDVYSLVNDGKWTFDRYHEMARAVTQDLNGDGQYDQNDRIGVLSTHDYLVGFSVSFGHKHVTKDETGRPVLTGATERMIDINDMMYELVQSDTYYMASDEVGTSQYSGMLSMFANNQGLFLTHRLSHVEHEILRNMENYGIVPNCKYDEAQENYITFTPGEVLGIPNVVKDLEMSALITEAANFETYRILIPTYFDIALQRKFTRDEASADMLDLIISNCDTDFAYMTIHVITNELFERTGFEKNYASWIEKKGKVFRKKLDIFFDEVSADIT